MVVKKYIKYFVESSCDLGQSKIVHPFCFDLDLTTRIVHTCSVNGTFSQMLLNSNFIYM